MRLTKHEFDILSKAIKEGWAIKGEGSRLAWSDTGATPFKSYRSLDSLVGLGLFARKDFGYDSKSFSMEEGVRERLECTNCSQGRAAIDHDMDTICPLCEGTCVDPFKLKEYL